MRQLETLSSHEPTSLPSSSLQAERQLADTADRGGFPSFSDTDRSTLPILSLRHPSVQADSHLPRGDLVGLELCLLLCIRLAVLELLHDRNLLLVRQIIRKRIRGRLGHAWRERRVTLLRENEDGIRARTRALVSCRPERISVRPCFGACPVDASSES